jgi:hypothetical protein
VTAEKGDRLRTSIKARVDDKADLWIWRGRVQRADGSTKASFAMSNAFQNPDSPLVHRVFHRDNAPVLTDEGRLAREVLTGVDSGRSVAGLASLAWTKYPDRFEHEKEALSFVRGVIRRFCDAKLEVDQ